MTQITNEQIKVAVLIGEKGYEVVVSLHSGQTVGRFTLPAVPDKWKKESWSEFTYNEVNLHSTDLVLKGSLEDELGCRWTVEDIFSLDNGEIRVTRNISLIKGKRDKSEVPFVFHIGFELDKSQYPLSKDDYHLIPGISYNDNPFGQGVYPKNITKNENQFVFRSDRLSIPGQILTTKDYTIGFYRLDEKMDHGDHQGEQFSVGFINNNQNHNYELSFFYPERELNHSYGRKGEWNEPYRKGLNISSGAVLSSTFYLKVFKRQGRHDYANVLWSIFNRTQQHNILGRSEGLKARQAIPLVEAYSKRVEGANKHFWTSTEKGAWYGHRVNHLDQTPILDIIDFRVGFIGRSLMMATETLRSGIDLGNKEWIDRAKAVFDWFCLEAPTKEGWFMPDYNGSEWFTSWKDNSISTRKQAEGIIQLLEAYHLANKQDFPCNKWLETAKNALDWLISKGKNGAYSRWYAFDGSPTDSLETHTPYVITALMKMYQVTADSRYLNEAKTSWLWVQNHIIQTEVYFGGTLDASTEDKEAAIITAEAGVMLYEGTRDQSYLDDTKKACDQILSYMMMYNVHFPEGTSLHEQGFKSFGTTIVSPENNHIDPYTTSALIKLGVYSGDLKYALAGVYNLQATTQDILPCNLQREIWYQGPWWYFDHLGKGNAQPWSVGWSQILAASVYKEVLGIFLSHFNKVGIGIDGCEITDLSFNDQRISFVCQEKLSQSRQIELLIPDLMWNHIVVNVNEKKIGSFSNEDVKNGKVKIELNANQAMDVVIICVS
jgi:hypothetical protein